MGDFQIASASAILRDRLPSGPSSGTEGGRVRRFVREGAASGVRPARRQLGLTLVEILVVLFVLGLGWFSLLPRLDVTRQSGVRGGEYREVNEFLDEVRRAAETAGKQQVVTGSLADARLVWNKKETRLPEPPRSVTVDGAPARERDYRFRVYADGIMDNVDVVLSSGRQIRSRPLTCQFIEAQP